MRYYSIGYSTIYYGISGFLCARYNVSSVNLRSHCDGCGIAFGVTHTISCSIDGLFIACHNKIRGKLLYLSRHFFNSAYARSKLLIHQGHTRSEQEMCQGSDKDKETRWDVIVQFLWDIQVNTIIDVKLGDADADTYNYNPMASLMTRWKISRKTSMVSTVTTNRNFFRRLFFQWTE